MVNTTTWFWAMDLGARLISLRKARGLSQQAMADAVGVHVNQIKRYETGATQPSLEGLKMLATALHITTDSLLFDEFERGPDEDLRLQFEQVSQFDDEEKRVVRALIDGLTLKHQAKSQFQAQQVPAAAPEAATKKPARERARA
jgi:transcriptional regulator with XRE-family HTH domain